MKTREGRAALAAHEIADQLYKLKVLCGEALPSQEAWIRVVSEGLIGFYEREREI